MNEPRKNFAERFLNFTSNLQRLKKPDDSDGVIYGDMHNRVFAVLLDLIFLLPLLLLLPVMMLGQNNSLEKTIAINTYQYFILGVYNIFFIYKYGATPGKIIVGLKVVDVITRDKLTLSQAVIRYLAYVTFPIGMFYGSARRNKRTLHDMFADTIVIYSPNRWYKRHADALKAKIKKFFNMK